MPLPKIVPETPDGTPECREQHRWSCYDECGTEVEVLELIYSLIRALKPHFCVETGTYLGFGTYYIAKALRDNEEDAHLWTADLHPENTDAAQKLIDEYNLSEWVTIIQGYGKTAVRECPDPVDFAFLDSSLSARIGEMEILYPKLAPSGLVVVHDTNIMHSMHGGPRNEILQFAAENDMQVINLDTPRGLILLRKKFVYNDPSRTSQEG